MKLISTALSLILFLQVSLAEAAANKTGSQMKPWFESKDCTSLEIKNAITGQALHISDVSAIKTIMQRIESISSNGQMMAAKMSVETDIRLTFSCGKSTSTIQILNDRFKTPTTGFNTEEKDKALENELNSDMIALLAPALNKRALKVKGLELSMGDFSITYNGTEVHQQEPGEPTFGPSYSEHFSVKDKSNKTQAVEIHYGQVPPQPLALSVNGSKLELLIHSSKDGKVTHLFPDYFMVTK